MPSTAGSSIYVLITLYTCPLYLYNNCHYVITTLKCKLHEGRVCLTCPSLYSCFLVQCLAPGPATSPVRPMQNGKEGSLFKMQDRSAIKTIKI